MSRTTLVVYRKEMLEILRDRRTLITIVLIALLMPVIFSVQGAIIQGSIQGNVRLGVSGALPTGFASYLPRSVTQVVAVEDPGQAVRGNAVDVALEFGPQGAGTQQARLFFDLTRTGSSRGLADVREAAGLYNRATSEATIRSHGLDPSLLTPVQLTPVDIASKQAASGLVLSFFLPLLLIIASVAGGMSAAVDASAGERERHTLEALLMTPATRGHILVGKILAVASVAFASTVVMIGAVFVAISRSSLPGPGGGHLSLSILSVLVMAWLGVLLAAACGAAMLAVGTLAKNFRQGQTYVIPLYLASTLAAGLVSTVPDWHPSLGYYAIPVLNVVLLLRDTLLRSPEPAPLLVGTVSLLAMGVVSWMVALRLFSREALITSGV